MTIDTTDPGQMIVVDGGEGDDEIDARGMTKDKTQPFLIGGPGKDVVIGSPGQDVISGGTGVDVAFLAGGLDTYSGSPATAATSSRAGRAPTSCGWTARPRRDASASPRSGAAPARRSTPRSSTPAASSGSTSSPAGGADTMRVDDMSGTDVTHVDLTLALARNLTTRDGSADSVPSTARTATTRSR